MQTEIAEILNDMRDENQRNVENFEKVLSGINTKLEAMEEDNETVELVRYYIAELKKAMEDRFSAAMIKYDAFEASLDGIISNQAGLAKTSQLKDLFGVFSAHNDAFMAEIEGQKAILETLGAKISVIDEKSFNKEELTSLIQDVSLDLSVLGENIQKTFSEMDESLKNLDTSEQLTKINDALYELKQISVPEYSKEFENLEKKLENIVSEEGFANFREDLGNFVQKIIDNSSALNSELSSNTERVLNAVNSIDYSDLKDDLAKLKECLQELKGISYQASFDGLSEMLHRISADFQEISDKVDKFEPVDYSYDLQQVSSKLDDLTASQPNFEEKFEEIKELVSSLDNSEAVKFQFEGFEKAFSKIVTAEDFLHFKGEFVEFLQKIIDNSNALYENSNDIKNKACEDFEKVNEVLADLSANIQYLRDISTHKPSEILDNISSFINDAVERLNSGNEMNFGDLKNSFEKIVSEISDIKEDFVQKNDANVFNISSGFDRVKISLENILTALNAMGATNESVSALDEKINRLNDVVSALSSDLLLKQDEVIQHINDVNDMHITQFKNVSENIDGIKGYIDESVECLKNYMAELEVSANSAKASGDEKLTQKLLDLESTLVQSTSEYEQKMELLQAKITEFAHIVENSNSDTEGKIASSLDELENVKSELATLNDVLKSAKISNDEKFGETVSLIDAGIENIIFNITNLSENIVSGVNTSVSENISGFDKKFDSLFEIINEFKSQHTLNNVGLIQDIEDKVIVLKDELGLINSDIASALECKSEEIIRSFEPVKTSIEEFTGYDFEKLLTNLKSQIELAFMNFSVDINSEFVANSEAVSKLEQAFKETFNKLSDIEECVNEKIQNNIELLNVALETVSRDIKINLEGKIEDNIGELKDYFDVAFNNAKIENSISDLKENLGTKLDETVAKLDVIVSDTAVEELHERFDEILENGNKISASVQNNLSQTETHVSDMISALHQKVDALANDSSDFDILEEIDGIKDIIFEQRKFFEVSSDEKASAIDKYLRDVLLKLDSVNLEKNADDIKEAILNALVSLVDQISFVEETEEIKDFVEEKTEEINQNLIEVKNQLKQLTSPGDDFDYTYTLQDVESDIAKLRLAVTNMSGNDFSDITDEIQRIVEAVEGIETSLTQDQIVDLKGDIEKLSEDIVSISSRTNKLLLTSDESYKALNDGLNNFSNIIYKLEDRINYLDNTEASERVEKKIDSIHSLAVEADNVNKVSRQVMMYLGEWIDSAGENISEIYEKTSEIDNIKASIQELREIIPEKNVILDDIESRFERQEERIDRLEKGLDKVLSILEQKDDTILERKADNIEKLLSALGKNIEKLTSYVDEE